MIILDVIQGSPEWHQARLGRPTASNFDKLVTTTGASSKQREKYLYQLAGERVSGKAEETYQNQAMQRGIEMEAEARAFYELTNNVKIEQVGICYLNEEKKVSCSPDGLVGKDGLIEIKCPLIYTHVGYLLNQNGGLLQDYFQQVQGQLYVTGRKWCDLISYFPGIKPLVLRVDPDEKFLKALAVELEVFCKQLKEITEKIR